MWRLVSKGRRAEDGKIRRKYPLTETPSANYEQRTEWNVRDTGGTAIFSIDPELTGGTKMTVELTVKHNKPCLKLHPGRADAGQKLRDFVSDNEIQTLNVAGPRASKEPEIGDFVKQVLDEAFPT
jgi:Circularly permutated YpsA SLOG family